MSGRSNAGLDGKDGSGWAAIAYAGTTQLLVRVVHFVIEPGNGSLKMGFKQSRETRTAL